MTLRGSTINKIKKNVSKFENDVLKVKHLVLHGYVLVIDPSSGSKDSMPGYAQFINGELHSSGRIDLDFKRPIQARLHQLHEELEFFGKPDVLIVERIRGNTAHEYLRWAVGVIVSQFPEAVILEMPTTIWKRTAKTQTDYTKGDEQDALMMGRALSDLAEQHNEYNELVSGKSPSSTRVHSKKGRRKLAKH